MPEIVPKHPLDSPYPGHHAVTTGSRQGPRCAICCKPLGFPPPILGDLRVFANVCGEKRNNYTYVSVASVLFSEYERVVSMLFGCKTSTSKTSAEGKKDIVNKSKRTSLL